MLQKSSIFILVGALAGGFLGWFVINLLILLRMSPTSDVPFLEILWKELTSSGASIFEFAVIIVGAVVLGASLMYALYARRELSDQTAKAALSEEANKTKDEFISMILHHLRTPLAGIRWGIKDILETEENKEKKNSLNKIYKEGVRVLDNVEHLLEVSRASRGRIAYAFEIVSAKDLAEYIKKKLDGLLSLAERKGINVKTDNRVLREKYIKVDRDKVGIVVQTLFENAVAYTPRGGSISILMEEQQNNFLFHITDTGMGIPQKDQQRIFLQFFRAENTRRAVPEGFGIGLFFAKIFIENFEGKIWFESQEGAGTTFHFSLPIISTQTEGFLQSASVAR